MVIHVDELARKLEGFQTINTICKTLGVKRSTAIKIVHELRKAGYVETSGGGKQPRFYRIRSLRVKKIEGEGLYDIINKYSRIKLVEPFEHKIIGKKLSVEESIVRAIKTGGFRMILASLELFRYVKNWSLLYKLAKKESMLKKVIALYETARLIVRVRRIDKRILNKIKASKEKGGYIIPCIKSKSREIQAIEKKWNVFVPFNIADLMKYKEWT